MIAQATLIGATVVLCVTPLVLVLLAATADLARRWFE